MIYSWQMILMIVISSIFLAWFLYRPIRTNLSDKDSNIRINRQRQNELASDMSLGLIEESYYQEAEDEIIGTLASELKSIESNNLEIKPLVWSLIIALFIAILSLSLYSQLASKAMSNSLDKSTEPLSLSKSIETLKDNLIENPQDFSTWKMLGMAQVAMGNLDDSIYSFEHAFEINPDDIDLLLQYSSAIAANQEGQFLGKPQDLIEKALAIDPQSIQVLYFAGIVSAHQADLDLAKEYWQKALYLMPDSHPDRSVIEEALETILNLQVK
mgnify:CR=1 FL=1